MKLLKGISIISGLFYLYSPLTMAQTEIWKLLGTVPGSESEIAASNPGVPFYNYRIPIAGGALQTVFHDIEVFALASNNRIVSVAAKRAFESSQHCEKAREVWINAFSPIFFTKYTGTDPRWQYQSANNEMTAGVSCRLIQGSPYPELRVNITHTKTNQELLQSFN